MRVLLDECLPRRLKRELVGHDARTAPEMGWASQRNGDLLRLAVDGEFDAFLTVDRKLQRQQNLSAYGDSVYDRLVDVKTTYDPDNVFHHNQNIRPGLSDGVGGSDRAGEV